MLVLEGDGSRFGLTTGDCILIRLLRDDGSFIRSKLPIWDGTSPEEVRSFITRNMNEKTIDYGVGIMDGETGEVVVTFDFNSIQVYTLD